MHDIKHFETNTDQVKKNLSKRGFDLSLVDSVLELNAKRKKLTTEVESNQAEIKKLSKEVGSIKKMVEMLHLLWSKFRQLKIVCKTVRMSWKRPR